jgi:hypothetical protein
VPGNNNGFERAAEAKSPLVDAEGVPWALRYTEERTRKVAEERKKLELERQELAGDLHHAADVRAIMDAQNAAVKRQVLAMGARLAPVLLAALGLPADAQATIQRIIGEEAETVCRHLASYEYRQIAAQRRKRRGK